MEVKSISSTAKKDPQSETKRKPLINSPTHKPVYKLDLDYEKSSRRQPSNPLDEYMSNTNLSNLIFAGKK
jgi:hypothetical protein